MPTATRRKPSKAPEIVDSAAVVQIVNEQAANPAAKLFNPFNEAIPFFGERNKKEQSHGSSNA